MRFVKSLLMSHFPHKSSSILRRQSSKVTTSKHSSVFGCQLAKGKKRRQQQQKQTCWTTPDVYIPLQQTINSFLVKNFWSIMGENRHPSSPIKKKNELLINSQSSSINVQLIKASLVYPMSELTTLGLVQKRTHYKRQVVQRKCLTPHAIFGRPDYFCRSGDNYVQVFLLNIRSDFLLLVILLLLFPPPPPLPPLLLFFSSSSFVSHFHFHSQTQPSEKPESRQPSDATLDATIFHFLMLRNSRLVPLYCNATQSSQTVKSRKSKYNKWEKKRPVWPAAMR